MTRYDKIQTDEQYIRHQPELGMTETDTHNSREVAQCENCERALLAAEVRERGLARLCANCEHNSSHDDISVRAGIR